MNKAGVPSGEILSLEDALNAPQVQHRNTFSTVNLDGIGELKLFNSTAKFSETTANVDAPPPTLSQHTSEILTQIGYTEAELEEFKANGII